MLEVYVHQMRSGWPLLLLEAGMFVCVVLGWRLRNGSVVSLPF